MRGPFLCGGVAVETIRAFSCAALAIEGNAFDCLHSDIFSLLDESYHDNVNVAVKTLLNNVELCASEVPVLI